MYKKIKLLRTSLKSNTSYIGERIEEKINRIMNNKEPITDGAPLIYTDRKDGVKPETNIRTDRFEIAVEAMDAVHKSSKAKREEFHKKLDDDNKKIKDDKDDTTGKTKEKNGGAEPIQGTDKK